jgi:DNA-binding CsgD family transcriptional regulator
VRGLAESAAAVLRRVAGDDDGALPHLESALGAFAHAGLPWESARVRLGIAEVVIRTNPALAAAEGRVALRTFRELGAARDADAAASLLRAVGSPTGAGPRVAGALTRREAEVLELVAEGLSNQAIADLLFLSKRTVEHHVGSILAKLGVTTRAEALATVLRAGG